MQQNIFKFPKISIVLLLALSCNSCGLYDEREVIFEINDVTKQQRFTYVTHADNVWKEVTMEGHINGCVEIAYFYYGHDSSAIADKNEWPKYTMAFHDSVSFIHQTEEGENARHGFIFIPGDATQGKIRIRVRTLY